MKRVNLNKFIEIASDDESVLADAADDFFNADRADLAFILADSASKASSQLRRAGLMMTKIYSLLESAGLNEGWLLDQFGTQISSVSNRVGSVSHHK